MILRWVGLNSCDLLLLEIFGLHVVSKYLISPCTKACRL